MQLKQLKNELQHLLSGTNGASYDALIQTVAGHLRSGESAGPMAKSKHQNKAQEAAGLIEFARLNELLVEQIPEERFIARGAEQRVYIVQGEFVVKLNDSIYYASWEDYFNNLLLHNFFFTDTAYSLLGFHLSEEVLYAVVQQPYIQADQATDLTQVKEFLVTNGFQNTRRHDYKHAELGLILEDLHDENVLTADGILHFIDTVFYINPNIFWADNF